MSIYTTTWVRPQITVEDWFKNNQQYDIKQKELSNLAFNMRRQANEIIDVSKIETLLNQQISNELLNERAKEISDSKDVIISCIQNAHHELQSLIYEKECCYRELQNLNPRFTVVNECNNLRCGRKKSDMCSDLVESELNNEHILLERVKKELSNKCEEAWTDCIKLQELIGVLQIDADQKAEALNIEKNTFAMAENSVCISRKPDLNHSINYSSYESWIENCKFLQSQTMSELKNCFQLREEMCQLRQRVYCEISAQFEATNFALRKRIFEIRSVLDQFVWQKQELEEEENRLMNELEKLTEKLNDEKKALQLFESQNINRIYRVNIELCQEKCTDNLEIQVINAKKRVETINHQIQSLKKAYNLLEKQTEDIQTEIKGKTCAITIDQRCLELRNELLAF